MSLTNMKWTVTKLNENHNRHRQLKALHIALMTDRNTPGRRESAKLRFAFCTRSWTSGYRQRLSNEEIGLAKSKFR